MTQRPHRCGRPRGEEGFTLVELVVTMCIALVVMGLVVPIVTAVSGATSTAVANARSSGGVRNALANLESEVASASQLCLPTTLTTAANAPVVTVGFALRAQQQTSATSSRWEQWFLDTTSGRLREEQFTPGGAGSWTTIATGVVNEATAPFALPSSPTPGSPEDLSLDLQLSQATRGAPVVQVVAAAPAYDTPYTLAPTTPCATAAPQQ